MEQGRKVESLYNIA